MANKQNKYKATVSDYVVLSDGRKLFNPPAGGKFTKREIENAVKIVANKRRLKDKTG